MAARAAAAVPAAGITAGTIDITIGVRMAAAAAMAPAVATTTTAHGVQVAVLPEVITADHRVDLPVDGTITFRRLPLYLAQQFPRPFPQPFPQLRPQMRTEVR